MLPRETLRNPKQRLIPLAKELIQYMLEHENREYQTPPGGHIAANTNSPSTSQLLAIQLRNEKELLEYSHEKEQFVEDLRTPFYNRARSKKQKDKCEKSSTVSRLYKVQSQSLSNLSSSTNGTSSIVFQSQNNLESQTEVDSVELRKYKCSVEDLQNSRQTLFNSSTRNSKIREINREHGKELDYQKPEICIYNSSSDSMLSIPCNQLKREYNKLMQNYYSMNQFLINTLVMPKSETSFLLNRYKLLNLKISHYYAMFKAISKDLKRTEHEKNAKI